MAVGTITGVLERIPVKMGRTSIAVLKLTCTASSTDASYPATVINPLAVTADSRTFDIRGLKLYSVKCYPGDTAPTDATDLTITDEYGVDLLGGKGIHLIDATSKTWTLVGPLKSYSSALITGDLTVTITNNAVNSAVTTLILELVGD